MYDEKRNIGIFIHNSLKLTYKAVAACTTPYYFGIHSFFPILIEKCLHADCGQTAQEPTF